MTCIVALATPEGNVWMGADSAGTAGHQLSIRRDPKVYRVGDMLFGFTTSFRMGQLLGHSFKPPAFPDFMAPDETLECFMATRFIDGVRACLKAGGFATTNNGNESGGEFLVGFRGRVFRVCGDFQVGENLADFDAVGCGADLALGALHATRHGGNAPDRITFALQAAEAFCSGVRGPFTIATIP